MTQIKFAYNICVPHCGLLPGQCRSNSWNIPHTADLIPLIDLARWRRIDQSVSNSFVTDIISGAPSANGGDVVAVSPILVEPSINWWRVPAFWHWQRVTIITASCTSHFKWALLKIYFTSSEVSFRKRADTTIHNGVSWSCFTQKQKKTRRLYAVIDTVLTSRTAKHVRVKQIKITAQ